MPRDNWHTHVFFGLHYDLHAQATDTELGRELTHEHLRERLLRVKPDWIQCDCKGHAGYTSWPTQIGSPSPGIIRDALRIHRDVTRELGIKLGMHYSGVWDTRAIELHPDWALIHADGSADPNFTCRLSGYVDELMIPQMLEIVDKYDVDGFWVDGENWASRPCWCERCRAEFGRRTGLQDVPQAAGDEHWSAWRGRACAQARLPDLLELDVHDAPAGGGCRAGGLPQRRLQPIMGCGPGGRRGAGDGWPRHDLGPDGLGLHQDRRRGYVAVGHEDAGTPVPGAF